MRPYFLGLSIKLIFCSKLTQFFVGFHVLNLLLSEEFLTKTKFRLHIITFMIGPDLEEKMYNCAIFLNVLFGSVSDSDATYSTPWGPN